MRPNRQFTAIAPAAEPDVPQPDPLDLLTRVSVKTIEADQQVIVRTGRVIARSFRVPMRYDIDCGGRIEPDVVRAQLRVLGLPDPVERAAVRRLEDCQ